MPPTAKDVDAVMVDVTKNVDRLDVRDQGRSEPTRGVGRGNGPIPTVSLYSVITLFPLVLIGTRGLVIVFDRKLIPLSKGPDFQELLHGL